MRRFFFITIIALTTSTASFTQPSAFTQLMLKTPVQSSSKQGYIAPFLISIKKDSTAIVPLQNRLPLDFYSTHLGAACKMELQLEKQTKLPIRIRLGSKEQVDYLEGKFSRNR